MSGDLERRLADLVAAVSDGEISAEEALAGEHSLSALGLTSLAWIRLVDAIEDAFGVDVDLGGDLSAFDRVDALAAHVSDLLDTR
ncbi:phosphopantetheine-binding protein [Nonomuraea sp. MCN248]|uniref:Phosphopantetheine-binding protein n=1 Tax=Nonomuraea corallina TaxID=2989783 RepID=A0ABT4SLD7_9ACTN|nr:phosphopantetheine-binding protein [Nonomuraea corallina]MDA0638052.1 phosphopantetheine-binding protein [Nonomuraea corallina]